MAADAAGDNIATAIASHLTSLSKKNTTIFDLPTETQAEIVAHCSQPELICLALVSKHFHELASAQLYRSFHIIFPDEDDLNFDSPIDGLAGGLDTLTTSDYNYASHLRDISMDTLSSGIKGESSYQSYLYSASCGKFFNTLLYLTLKKAKSLEAFRWNIRVELSRQVYRELHRISSLKKLHVRMQAGESYYVPPPPLPVHYADTHHNDHSVHWADVTTVIPIASVPSTISLPLTTDLSTISGGPPPALVPPSKSLPKSKLSKRGASLSEPSTLSGFKNLQSLSVLDIDDLDIMTELKTCIKNSTSTLKSLQLSFSTPLASQARKPSFDSDADESDMEDEFQGMPIPHDTDGTGPAKSFRAQEERKIQEGFLGRVLDVELPHPPKRDVSPTSDDVSAVTRPAEDAVMDTSKGALDAHQQFIASIRSASDQLMTVVHGTRERTSTHQEILDTIEKAAKQYVASAAPQGHDDQSASSSTGIPALRGSYDEASGAESSTQNDPSILEVSKGGLLGQEPDMGSPSGSTGILASAMDSEDKALNEIDMEHVEVQNEISEESADAVSDVKPARVDLQGDIFKRSDDQQGLGSRGPNVSCLPLGSGSSQSNTVQSAVDSETARNIQSLQDRISSFHTRMQTLLADGSPSQLEEVGVIKLKIKQLEDTIRDIVNQYDTYQTRKSHSASSEIDHTKKQPTELYPKTILDYLKETRGMSLETLKIHLVPVKASVLSRAVDLQSLKSLTLLNVGLQAPIWTLLSKENQVQPLPLRNVYTDNVSDAFLKCMAQLPELHELYMLERNSKAKPESFATRTSNSIDQIRRTVLAKHMPTLKRLMIKDESSGSGSSWDVNEKAMIHICTRGKQLEELSISLNIQAMHAFMQYLPGLTSLHALHIIRFRNSDTCIWVMREILRFIVDNLSHHPECKLEWIAMEEDRVDRVVRTSAAEEKERREQSQKKKRAKGKAPAFSAPMMISPPMGSLHDTYPVFPSIALDPNSDSDSDDDDDDSIFDDNKRLRFKTVGPMQFYDVWGVKIFDKEIRSGRL